MTSPLQRWWDARRALASRDATVAGAHMHARRSSATPRYSSPTLVLLGGTALSGRYLFPVAAELGLRFPVWVPDLAGRGSSGAPRSAMTVQDHADHLTAWMAHVGIGQACFVANSMGCQIAVEVAVRHPQSVSHVVLQGPTVDARARTLPRQLIRLARDSRHEPASLGPLELVDWFRGGLVEIVGQALRTVEHRIEDRLPLVRCPVLIVRGSLDAVAPACWVRQLEAVAPDGRLRQVPGAAHAMVYSHPLELARLTEAFLRGSAAPVPRPR